MPRPSATALLSLFALSCAGSKSDSAPPAGDTAATESSPSEVAQVVLAAMDPAADPCQDFYQYACGGWIKATELPSDKPRWTRSFGVLREHNREVLKQALDGVAKNGGDGETQKLADFFNSCMDEQAVEAAGHTPLQPIFDEIKGVKNAKTFMALTGKLHAQRVRPLFGLGVGPDDKNPKMNIAHIRQGGLGLPDRDYYFDDKRKALLEGYEAHVAKNFVLLGEDEAAAKKIASDVVAFETKLAGLHMDRAERRDPDKVYNKIDKAGLRKQVRKLDWNGYFEGLGYPNVEHVNVDSVDYLKGAAKVVGESKKQTLQNYLRWTVVRAAASRLSKAFVDADFEFYGKALRGQKEIEARWKRCTTATNWAFTHPMGKLYVERTFQGESKDIALDLIGRIEMAFQANLPKLAWMDETTRSRAIEKMKAIHNKVGYPDKWRDYEDLEIDAKSFFANSVASARFEHDYDMKKVGKAVDRDEWRAGPPVVNASYSGTRNEMWFPAGILQAPFFDKDHPMAMNFGGIGMVMGHELTHGFDDQGRKYDADGMLRQWWEDGAVAKFEERAKCVDDLYSRQEVEPGLTVNGKLTLGENTADLGGIKQTFEAYQQWASEQEGGDAEPHVEGLTNEQLVFIGFAQVWCTVQSPEYLRVQVATDPHSPARFRVNVPATQSPHFGEVFECAEGTPMNPKDKCEVW